MPTADTESPAQNAESAATPRPPREKDRVDSFARRHIGPNQTARAAMLAELEFENLDALIDATVPKNIRLDHPLNLPEAKSEWDALAELRHLARKNVVARSFIGAGYSDTITPPVIQRNILENPGWYTAYTPYQAEIAQGRLEALLNFQTMITDLTALDIANASLLDEGTAAAEAMALCHAAVGGRKDLFCRGQLSSADHRDRPNARTPPRHQCGGRDFSRFKFDETVFGALVQYPATDGAIYDYESFAKAAHDVGALLVVAADILALTLLKPPGEFGADVAVGSTQRFGVPLGFGGPHAAYFATRDAYKRHMAGRLVGVSHDATGRPGYRLALQTREQHIRRDKATSNICTAQVLLAVIASMYAVYHGPRGLRAIAEHVHGRTNKLASSLRSAGFKIGHEDFFDTIRVDLGEQDPDAVLVRAAKAEVNLRRLDEHAVGISLDETTSDQDLKIFAKSSAPNSTIPPIENRKSKTENPPTSPTLSSIRTTPRRSAALSPPARVARPFADDFDDPPRVVHDEVERDRGDVSDFLAGVREAASVRAGRAICRLSRDVRSTRGMAR